MKKILILVCAACAFAASAFAGPVATLGDIKGKVEVKLAKGDWTTATEGMKIDLNTTISTGFDSTATLAIEKTTVVVKPLTRLTLDKLLEQSPGSTSTSLFLRVGSVQAKVKATVPGTPQDFKVQSPYSTASVRGTEFEYDGLTLNVTEGIVTLVPGRPKRDIQSAGTEGGSAEQEGEAVVEDSGFEGSIDVGEADESAAVAVEKDQKAAVVIAYHLDTGTAAPKVTNAGVPETASASGMPTIEAPAVKPPASTTGGVTITIVK
jgi:hypothetical protein